MGEAARDLLGPFEGEAGQLADPPPDDGRAEPDSTGEAVPVASASTAPGGGSMRSVQPRAASTARALPIWAVAFPASSSTRNRTPTPAAPANWSCRSP